ncbi:MAG: hypothetical protein NUW09_00210 [Deltaproteobacteria bacterium]|nr:hypothetical protein [Deltaproteobacteria bacterium]
MNTAAVKLKLKESMLCPGKWKVWVILPNEQGWFSNGKAFANRRNAEVAALKAYPMANFIS